MSTVLGDTMGVKKWLEQKAERIVREIPMLSLTKGCATLLIRTLQWFADLTLYVSMKTEGLSILNHIHSRRGVSLVKDIGLPMSADYLIKMFRNNQSLGNRVLSQRKSDLKIRQESLFASDVRYDEKLSTHLIMQERVVKDPQSLLSIQE